MKNSLRQALSTVLNPEIRRFSSSFVSFQSQRSIKPTCTFSSFYPSLFTQHRTSHLLSSTGCRRNFSIKPHLSQSNKFNVKNTELSVPVPWGVMSGQTFGDPIDKATNKPNKPIVALHGYLDNSNSFKPLASVLCNHGFYIVALDFPGHGFSSHLSKGMQYSPKVFLSSVRRVIKHLNLKNFMMVTHSFGSNIALLYDTVFQNEVKGIFIIDWVLNLQRRKQEDLHTYWKKGIDGLIEAEQKHLIRKKELSEKSKKSPLTHEFALDRLMEANKHLDIDSAKLLLERGLVVNANSELNFTRDIKVKIDFSLPDLFLEVHQLFPNIQENLSAPTLLTIAWPPSYGEEYFSSTKWVIDRINTVNKKTRIETTQFEGSHHFHMIKPQETADIMLKFIKDKGVTFE